VRCKIARIIARHGSTLWFCKEGIYREGSGGVETKGCSHALHFYESHAMEIFDKIQQILHFLVD